MEVGPSVDLTASTELRLLFQNSSEVRGVLLAGTAHSREAGWGLESLLRSGRPDSRLTFVSGDFCSITELAEGVRGGGLVDPIRSFAPHVVLLAVESDAVREVNSYQYRTSDVGQLEFRESLNEAITFLKEIESQVLLLNGSSFDPTDETSNYHRRIKRLPETIKRFNLEAIRSSMDHGISIIDVDRLFAERGARSVVRTSLDYVFETRLMIGAEILRVLEDRGLLENVATQGGDLPDGRHTIFKLQVPYVDRSIENAYLAQWHKDEGEMIPSGDAICDLGVAEIVVLQRETSAYRILASGTEQPPRYLRRGARRRIDRRDHPTTMFHLRLSSADRGVLRRRLVDEGQRVRVGDILGVVTKGEGELPDDTLFPGCPPFRVVAHVEETSQAPGR